MNLPEAITPDQLADKYGWSERAVRNTARRLGACLIMGKSMTLLPKHVQKIMEAIECPSSSTSEVGSGITAAPLPKGDYAALQASRRNKKTSRGARLPRS